MGLVPGRHRGVAQQDGRVGGHGRAEQRGPGRRRRPGGREDPGEVRQRGRARGGAVGAEDPRPHAHRRGQLEDPQHVVEPGGPSQVVDQRHRRDADPAQGRRLRGAGQAGAPGELGRRGQHRGGARQATEEQVGGHVRLFPHRLLDDGPAVVGAEFGARDHELLAPARAAAALALALARVTAAVALGRAAVCPAGGGRPGLAGAHRTSVRDPRKAVRTMAPTPAAARPACFHMRGRDRVGTTGSGGRP